MNCEEIFDRTEEYLAGWMSDEECAEFEAHIAECEECRGNVEFAKKLNGVMSSMPSVEPPEEFLEKLHEKIRAEKKTVAFYKKWQPYSALAACILLAVVIRTNVTDELNKSTEYLQLTTPVPSGYVQTNDTASDVAEQTAEVQADITATVEPVQSSVPTAVSTPEAKRMAQETQKPVYQATAAPTVIVNTSPAEKISADLTSTETASGNVPVKAEKVPDMAVESIKAEAVQDVSAAYNIPKTSLESVPEAAMYMSETAPERSKASGGGSGGALAGGAGVSSVGGVMLAENVSSSANVKMAVNKISSEHKAEVVDILNRLGIRKNGEEYVAAYEVYTEFVMQLQSSNIDFDGNFRQEENEVRFVIEWE